MVTSLFDTLQIFIGSEVFLGYVYLALTLSYFLAAVHYSYLYKHRILLWVGVGALYNFWSLSFLWSAFPLPWADNLELQFFAFLVTLTIVAIVVGLSFSVISYALRAGKITWYLPLLVGASFGISDIVRSTFVSLLLLGKESSPGLHYTAGSVGMSLSYTPFVSLSYGGGVFFLSAVFGYILFVFYSVRGKKLLYYMLPVVVLGMISHIQTPTSHTLEVTIVTTNFKDPEQGELWRDHYIKRYEAIASILSKASASDVVIFPESTLFLRAQGIIESTPRLPYSLIIDGDIQYLADGKSNQSIFHDPLSKITRGNQKKDLMAMSEYIPYIFSGPFGFIFGNTKISELLQRYDYRKGVDRYVHAFIKDGEELHIASLLCSEATSMSALSDIRKKDRDLLIIQSNLSVYKEKKFYSLVYLGYARVAAATIRTPTLAVTNTGNSLYISSSGKILGFYKTGLHAHHIRVDIP